LRRLLAVEALETSLRRLDASRRAVALFIGLAALLMMVLAPTNWNGNEENYLQLASRRVSPQQFHQYSAVFDSSRSRVVSETILGTAVKWFGYERAHFVLRIVMALLYAIGLAVFFSAVGVSLLDALFIVSAFCVAREHLLGDEWLFWGVEAKTFAYSLVFLGFGLALRHRWGAAVVSMAAATYLHFLVGGFWAGLLVIYQRIQQQDNRRAFLSAALFVALVAPLVVVVVQDATTSPEVAFAEGPSADFIYAERAAHHVAPFQSLSAFWTSWFPRIVATGGLLGALIGLQRRKFLPPIAVVAIIGLTCSLAAVAIAFVDRHTNYVAKFYLFRPSTFSLFLAITAVTWAVKRHCRADARRALIVVQATVILGFVGLTVVAHGRALRRPPAIPQRDQLIEAIERNSDPHEIVLLEPYNEMHPEYQRLHRVIPRPTLITRKFMPSNPPEIHRWYELIQRRERLFASGCAESMQPPVKLLVIFQRDSVDKMRSCGELVWQQGDIALIRIRETVLP